MATSGTYSFSLSVGELTMQAYARLGIRRPLITAESGMLLDATNEINLMFASWANKGPNLWTVDSQAIALIAGTSTYTVDAATIMILDARLTTTALIDRVLTQISRSEYNSYPNKATSAPPTVFWYDRTIAQTVTFWPVPDTTYTFNFYRFRRSQDAALAGGQSPELPYRWLDAAVSELAARLAVIYAPDKYPLLAQIAGAAYQAAAEQDVEDVPIKISMDFSRYNP